MNNDLSIFLLRDKKKFFCKFYSEWQSNEQKLSSMYCYFLNDNVRFMNLNYLFWIHKSFNNEFSWLFDKSSDSKDSMIFSL